MNSGLGNSKIFDTNILVNTNIFVNILSSTRTMITLLRPWIRRFAIIISAWWFRASSEFTWEEVKTSAGKLGKWSTPKRVRIRPKHSAPSLSRDRRIKMHQSINQSICNCLHDDLVFHPLGYILSTEKTYHGL